MTKTARRICGLRLPTTAARVSRRGSALLVVMIVIGLLSLSAYSFTDHMVTDGQMSAASVRAIESRLAADSGIETCAELITLNSYESPRNLYHNPALFDRTPLTLRTGDGGAPAFTILAPVDVPNSGRPVRFGMVDESSKLNLNTLVRPDLSDVAERGLLMGLPGMTHAIADAVLDWIDEDRLVRQFGVEPELDSSRDLNRASGNRPMNSVDELLMVRGVTPWLLYGNTLQASGGFRQSTSGSGSGDRQHPGNDNWNGWQQYLTVYSGESNRQMDGTLRINLNQSSLTELYDQLASRLGTTVAQFVVSYRINGPVDPGVLNLYTETNAARLRLSGEQRGRIQRGEIPDPRSETTIGSENTVRAGIDLSGLPVFRIRSLFDLFGIAVRADVNNVDSVIDSPWSADPASINTVLPELEELLTVEAGPTISGRININLAPREVLLGLPGMTRQLADALEAARASTMRELMQDKPLRRKTIGWLIYEGRADLKQMRLLAPYINTGGDVFRVVSIGSVGTRGPTAQIEAVVDAAQLPARIVFRRTLPGLNFEQLRMLHGNSSRTTGFGSLFHRRTRGRLITRGHDSQVTYASRSRDDFDIPCQRIQLQKRFRSRTIVEFS